MAPCFSPKKSRKSTKWYKNDMMSGKILLILWLSAQLTNLLSGTASIEYDQILLSWGHVLDILDILNWRYFWSHDNGFIVSAEEFPPQVVPGRHRGVSQEQILLSFRSVLRREGWRSLRRSPDVSRLVFFLQRLIKYKSLPEQWEYSHLDQLVL